MSGNARSSGSNAGKVALAGIVVLTEQRLPLIETATRESSASACGADRPSACNSCRSLFCVGLVCAASAYAIADERLHAAAPPEASAAAVERAARDAGRRRDASAKTRAPRWTAVRRICGCPRGAHDGAGRFSANDLVSTTYLALFLRAFLTFDLLTGRSSTVACAPGSSARSCRYASRAGLSASRSRVHICRLVVPWSSDTSLCL